MYEDVVVADSEDTQGSLRECEIWTDPSKGKESGTRAAPRRPSGGMKGSVAGGGPSASSASSTSSSTSGAASGGASALSSAPAPAPAAVCRDFLRNVCTRGAKCKFSHRSAENNNNSSSGGNGGGSNGGSKPSKRQKQDQSQTQSSDQAQALQDAVVFCHDYQNQSSSCARPNCRFIHCSRDDELEFRRSGYLPPRVRDQVLEKGIAPDLPAIFGDKPVCKDHLKGECKWAQCRFRHLTKQQFDLEIGHRIAGHHQQQNQQRPCSQSLNSTSSSDYVSFEQGQSLMSSSHTARGSLMWSGLAEKRRRVMGPDFSVDDHHDHHDHHDSRLFFDAHSGGGGSKTEVELLRQENQVLKQRLDEMRKQVQDLHTTNEFLLDQNAQLRLGVKQQQHAHPQQEQPQPQPPPPQPLQQQHPPQSTANVVNAAPAAQLSVPIQPAAMSMTATIPPATITMAAMQPPQPVSIAAIQQAPVTIAMSGGGQIPPPQQQQPPPPVTIAAIQQAPPPPVTIAMSGAAQMSHITAPTLTAPVPPPPQPTLSLAVEPMGQAAVDTVCRAGPPPPPQAGPPPQPQQPPPQAPASMPGHTMATVPTISCHAALPAQQAAPSTVHVQETRLVSYPITSMRQQM